MIRVEVGSETDVTRMVAAFTTLPVLKDSDYEMRLVDDSGSGGTAMRRAWRTKGVRGATWPTDWVEDEDGTNAT